MFPKDPLIEELHEIRDEISRESNDDIRKIAQAAKRRQDVDLSSKTIVRFQPNLISTEKVS